MPENNQHFSPNQTTILKSAWFVYAGKRWQPSIPRRWLVSYQCQLFQWETMQVCTAQWHLPQSVYHISTLHGCWRPGRTMLSAKHICPTGFLCDWPVDVQFSTCLSRFSC